MKPLSLLSCFALIMSLAIFSGCSSKISTHGHPLEKAKLDLLVPGETSLSDILILFGKPSFDGAFGSGKIYYNNQVMETEVAGHSKTVSRTLLILMRSTFALGTDVGAIDCRKGPRQARRAHRCVRAPGDRIGLAGGTCRAGIVAGRPRAFVVEARTARLIRLTHTGSARLGAVTACGARLARRLARLRIVSPGGAHLP